MKLTSFLKPLFLALISFLILVSPRSVCGQSPLGVYEFTGLPFESNPLNEVTTQPSHATFSRFNRNGVTMLEGNFGKDIFNSYNWNNEFGQDYIQFTIKAKPGYKLSLEKIYFEQLHSRTGPLYFKVAHNATGSFDIATPDTTSATSADPGLNGKSFIWNFSDFTTANGDSVTFRIYAWNITSGRGTFRVDNVTLYGSVIPDVRVNEFHYYNTAQTQNSFVELLVPKDYGQDSSELLADVALALYNAAGQVYFAATLADFTSFEAGIYYLNLPAGMVEAPGGISVSAAGKVTHFISYGGSVSAADGPAAGLSSQNIGITEAAADGAQNSVYLPPTPNTSSWAKYSTNRNTKGYPNDYVILPVELVHFKANNTEQGVELVWKTELEKDNDYFQVERSLNAQQFRSIGRVKSREITTGSTYTYLDQSARGTVYYRLKQVDISGFYTYSPVIAITTFAVAKVLAYPNPVSDRIQLQLSNSKNKAVVQIMDLQGRRVASQDLAPESNQAVNVKQLHAGSYILFVVQDGQKWSQPFVKQ